MKNIDRAQLLEALNNGVTLLNLSLSDAQHRQLLDYLSLLVKWNAVYNLTAVRDPSQMVVQHLLDSLSAVPAFQDKKNILDVGAGGGLPGMVLAIARPDMKVSLIDTVHKKTAFLTQVKAELNLQNVTVHTGRVEALQVAIKFDAITSRAFAELRDFIDWSSHLLEEKGEFIALKGVLPDDEIKRMPPRWAVSKILSLLVPGMDAQRHLIFVKAAEK